MAQTSATPTPIVIVGAARSGTKFLRSLLAASPECAAVPYDVNYLWRSGHEELDHDVLPAEAVDADLAAHIRSELVRLAGAGQPGCRFLIEKTVSNGMRVPFVNAVLPDCRFVHLIRDGRAVVESAERRRAPADVPYLLGKARYLSRGSSRYVLRYLKELLTPRGDRPRLWGPRYPGMADDARAKPLLEVCALQWLHTVTPARADLAALPQERVFELRYEELVARRELMERLCAFVGLNNPEPVLTAHRDTVSSEGLDKWRSRWSEETVQRVEGLIGEQLRRFGYTLESAT